MLSFFVLVVFPFGWDEFWGFGLITRVFFVFFSAAVFLLHAGSRPQTDGAFMVIICLSVVEPSLPSHSLPADEGM